MASGYETNMVEALARLMAGPPFADDFRRAHRTAPPREAGRVVHLIEGWDEPVGGKPCGQRSMLFTVAIFVRSDSGIAATDPLRIAVNDRLTAPWTAGIVVTPGRIMADAEVADMDPAKLVMPFTLEYRTAGEFSLLLPT